MSAADSHSPSPIQIRTLFLSDFHFGYKGVDGAALLNCLQTYAPQKIYLAGDIIDGWKLSKRWHWRADYTRIFDALVDHKKRGTKIIYLPGNHDERVRRANPLRRTRFALRFGIRVCNSCIHRLKDGRKIIVLHGDQFDNALISGTLSRVGDWFYDHISEWLGLTERPPLVLVDGKLQKFSLAKALMKKSAKTALQLLSNLERAVVRLVTQRQADGLICGHTHVPVLRQINPRLIFGNCGMWMGHTNTAIIETLEGALELINWPDMRQPGSADDASISASQAVHLARHYETALLIRKIRKLWPARSDVIDRKSAKPFKRQEGIVSHKQRDLVDQRGLTALGDEFTAQARRLQIRQADAGQNAAGQIHAARGHIGQREIAGHAAENAQH